MKINSNSSLTTTASVSYGKTSKTAKSSSKITKRISALSYMQRLASARTPTQTANVIRSARLEAQTMKSLGVSESEIQAAKLLAKKVEKKGNLKISRLKKEILMEQQRKQAIVSKQAREAARISKNLSAKRKSRKAEEESDVLHALPMRKEERQSVGSSYYSAENHIDVMVDSYDFSMPADGINLEV